MLSYIFYKHVVFQYSENKLKQTVKLHTNVSQINIKENLLFHLYNVISEEILNVILSFN